MTKQEAIALEKKISELVSDNLDYMEAFVSFNLASDLLVTIGDDKRFSFNWNEEKQTFECVWISISGYYSTIVEIVKIITKYFNKFQVDVKKLIWSYEHKSELEEVF